jgi:hypothetical protein
MDERDILLVLTICQILGKPTNLTAVLDAHHFAKDQLAHYRQQTGDHRTVLE